MNIKIADRTLCKSESGYSFKEKIEIARQLENLRVDVVELPQIENIKTDTLLVKTVASFVKNSVLSVNAGMTKDGVEIAAEALKTAEKPRIRIEIPVSTVGMEYICHKKAPKMLETLTEMIAAAKAKCNEVEFYAIDATRAESDVLESFISAAINAGATHITICDTAAEMMPDSFGNFVTEVKKMAGEGVSIAVMCENKNGLAAANAVMAVRSGADSVKTDVGGEGIALSTMAGIIKNCGNSYNFESNVKYTELNRIIKQIEWIIGSSKSDKSAVAAIETEESGIMLDANDDKDAVVTAVLKLGYDLSEEDAVKVYEEFLRVASKKQVGAKELDAIVASVALQVEPTYKLVSYVINNGNIISSSAQITLEKEGAKMQGICIGDGPVGAAFLAIEQIIGHHYELDDFQIQSVTEGKEAMGSALVKLRQNGKLYSGKGISTDIMGAAIRAYINAVNKIVYEEAN